MVMKTHVPGGLNFTVMERRLTDNSRASDVMDDNSEIFPDVLAAKVWRLWTRTFTQRLTKAHNRSDSRKKIILECQSHKMWL